MTPRPSKLLARSPHARKLTVPASLFAAAAATLALVGCELATPFRGDGYSRAAGVTLPGVGDRVVVGMTHAVLNGANRRAFDDSTRRVIKSLP